jgi:Trypsin-co-occurring domain 1
MATLITTTDGGAEITIETAGEAGGFQNTGAGSAMRGPGAESLVRRAEGAFTAAVGTVKSVSRQFVAALDELGGDAPEALELSFGIKFTASGDVWVAQAAAEAQLVAKVTWRRKP